MGDWLTLSGAAEKYGPEDDEKVVVLRWDNWAAPTSEDLVSPILRYSQYDDVSLYPPVEGDSVDYYYVDEYGEIYSTEEMIEEPPNWFDPPEEVPPWYDS